MKSFLSDNDRSYMRMQHRKMKEKRYADKIKTILFLDMGDSYESVAKRLMLDESTVRGYYKQYEQKGIEELLQNNYIGKTCYLQEHQLEELDKYLQCHLYTDSKAIMVYIEKRYGVSYTHDAVKKLLHRLEYVYKKPKRVPGKADSEEQIQWIKTYAELKKAKRPEDKILFMDGCHPVHNAQIAYGWIKKGKEKMLKTNTGRQRININGAYDIEEHKVTIREDKSINAQSTIALFEQLLEKYPIVTIYIILDNARYYHSTLVKEFLSKHPRVKIKSIPTYSPNLNLIERLWKFFKEKITYNTYYQTFEEFKDKSMYFFNHLENYKTELERRMTEKFQIIPAVQQDTS